MLTIKKARKAIMGAQILADGELLASYNGRAPDECLVALKLVQGNPDEFIQLVFDELSKSHLFSEYFGPLVKIRLRQQGYLASPLIGVLFDEPNPIEARLQRIRENGVSGLEYLKREYRHVSKSPDKGDETDKVARDLLAEILVIDFLVQLNFSNITRPFSKDQPHIDVLAMKDEQYYAIEITRKQEVDNWKTIEFGNLEDCSHQDNLDKIRSVLRNALWKKNGQFSRAVAAGTIISNSLKVVAIKTSDYGFAECIDQAKNILEDLILDPKLEYIDCVWVIPNIDPTSSEWLCI
ncbi:hypothetical protein D6779_09225 [Candidatus Parcubacteria bacterium]|nr:MAG: hypothetical protein D6779_09225 [Candidatus Parcubacteria bacterium]